MHEELEESSRNVLYFDSHLRCCHRGFVAYPLDSSSPHSFSSLEGFLFSLRKIKSLRSRLLLSRRSNCSMDSIC